MHVQSENGSVMKSNIPAKNVKTNAQNPGPSGSAEMNKKQIYEYLEFRKMLDSPNIISKYDEMN